MTRIICAGHINWDVTLQVSALPDPDGETQIQSHRHAGGGSAANVAAVLAGLGYDPMVLGSVGTDEYGPLVRQELDEAGVDCTYLQRVSGETTVKYLIVDGDGEVLVLARDGANEAYSVTDLPERQLARARAVHLTGQDPETARRLAKRARQADVLVSVDPGRRVTDRDFDPVLELADIVFCNEQEARAVDANAPAQTVVKKGADGATVEWDGNMERHEGFDVTAVDTAGAGDSFAAGFLSSIIDGLTPDDALAVGNACGALAARTVGARTRISWEDIDELVDS